MDHALKHARYAVRLFRSECLVPWSEAFSPHVLKKRSSEVSSVGLCFTNGKTLLVSVGVWVRKKLVSSVKKKYQSSLNISWSNKVWEISLKHLNLHIKSKGTFHCFTCNSSQILFCCFFGFLLFIFFLYSLISTIQE